MPCVNVSLISCSLGISIGRSIVDVLDEFESGSAIGASSIRVQDCWKSAAASIGVERRNVVISNVFCSISRCNDCTRANNSASNGSMSSHKYIS